MLSPQRGVGSVRILAGQWKRSVVPVPVSLGLRPTPERVRETVFDWLTHLFGSLDGLCALDMFAGTGAMGLEAASRGAASVDWLEVNRQAAASLRATLVRLKADTEAFRVFLTDAFAFTDRPSRTYDVVFIDPPFAASLQEKAIRQVLGSLSADGVIYVESPGKGVSDELLETLGLVKVRAGSAGVVVFELLARASGAMASRVRLPRTKEKGKRS